jgi:hypothetical protein
MSTILKALRRLEEEREADARDLRDEVLAQPRVEARRPRLPLLVGAGAAGALIVVGGFWLLDGRGAGDDARASHDAPSPAVARAAPSPASDAAGVPTREIAVARELRAAPRPAPTPELRAAPRPAPAPEPEPARVAPRSAEPTRAPVAPPRREPAPRPAAEVASSPPPKPAPDPAPARVAAAPAPAPVAAVARVAAAAPEPAIVEPAALAAPSPIPQPASVAAPPPEAAGPEPETRAVPGIVGRPEVARRAPLPRMVVARTLWHPTPGRRLAYLRVEGRPGTVELREGDAVGDAVVQQIDPSAVVFLHRGVEIRRRIGADR